MIRSIRSWFPTVVVSLLSMVPVAHADVCTVGETRSDVVIADALSEQCLSGCDLRTDEEVFQVPEGWAILNYETVTRHDRGRTTMSLQQLARNGHFSSSYEFESVRKRAGTANAVEPTTKLSIQVGGSIEAQAIEKLNRKYAASHTTLVLKVTAQGREFRGGSSQRIEALRINLICVGTLNGYREAIQKEMAAAKR